jgi:hypothetical protein
MQNIKQSQIDLLQVILANTTSAMKISQTLAEHSSDKILKGDEIICGLIYRLMVPMTDEEISFSMNEAEDLIYHDESSDEDEFSENEIIDDKDDSILTKKVRTNNCNCNICSQVRVCLLNFNDYIPKDELGDKFKCSILETCQQYNRII